MVHGLRAQSPKYDWDQGSELRIMGSGITRRLSPNQGSDLLHGLKISYHNIFPLARTAEQPRVLVALIQCATMATEVVEVATESEEEVIINCVAIFYEEGKEGENFRRAVRFNNRLLH